MPLQPTTRRHLVAQMRRRLDANIAPIVVVRRPRQIGKTTAQFQIIQDSLNEGVDPRRILRVQFDDLQTLGKLSEPILRISESNWGETVSPAGSIRSKRVSFRSLKSVLCAALRRRHPFSEIMVWRIC